MRTMFGAVTGFIAAAVGIVELICWSQPAKWILPDESGGMHDRKARLTFPRLAVTELGEVDIAPRITHMATGVGGWLQLPDQSDRARGDLIGIQI